MPSLVLPHLRFVETLPDPALIVKTSGEIVLANHKAEALFGYQPGQLTGQSVQVLLPESARDLHPKQVEQYFANPRVRHMGSGLNLFGRRRDGSEFPVDIALSPIHEGDELFALALLWVVDTNRRPTSPLNSR